MNPPCFELKLHDGVWWKVFPYDIKVYDDYESWGIANMLWFHGNIMNIMKIIKPFLWWLWFYWATLVMVFDVWAYTWYNYVYVYVFCGTRLSLERTLVDFDCLLTMHHCKSYVLASGYINSSMLCLIIKIGKFPLGSCIALSEIDKIHKVRYSLLW